MEKPVYSIEMSSKGLWYEFESVSNEKTIKKVVCYYPFKENADLFELSFGDLQDDGTINVFAVSNNQDTTLILNTVIGTLDSFFELYPQKSVLFTGSSESRNRLYRAVISKALQLYSDKYQVLGISFDDEPELFLPNKNYFAFQISLKL
jgi:hypothetical protein